MKRLKNWVINLFRLKPRIKLQEPSFSRLSREVRIKMFAGANLGLAILFILFEELGKGKAAKRSLGPDMDRYKGKTGVQYKGTPCADIISYATEEAIDLLKFNVGFVREPEPSKLFHNVFVNKPASKIVNKPYPGILVLFEGPEFRCNAHLGVVSRVLTDSSGNIIRWWYISANEGIIFYKNREVRGDKKKGLTTFLDISNIKT